MKKSLFLFCSIIFIINNSLVAAEKNFFDVLLNAVKNKTSLLAWGLYVKRDFSKLTEKGVTLLEGFDFHNSLAPKDLVSLLNGIDRLLNDINTLRNVKKDLMNKLDKPHLYQNIKLIATKGSLFQRGSVLFIVILAGYGSWAVCSNLKDKFFKKQ